MDLELATTVGDSKGSSSSLSPGGSSSSLSLGGSAIPALRFAHTMPMAVMAEGPDCAADQIKHSFFRAENG